MANVVYLNHLAPSIPPLANSDKARDGTPDPESRLTILLGAGASLYAKAPSTNDLTAMVARRPVAGMILQRLRDQSASKNANFEDVLHVLEELDSITASSERAPTMMRAFLQPTQELGISAVEVRRERFELLEAISKEFATIDYDANWRPLYNLLRPQLDVFDLDIFTLNYDLVSDVVTYGLSALSDKKWFDGFGGVPELDGTMRFQPDEYATWKAIWGHNYLTHAHLHGALSYAYAAAPSGLAHAVPPIELVYKTNLEAAQETWKWATQEAVSKPSFNFYGVVPIVSGLRKLEKLTVRPYADYYARFAQAVSESPRLLIVGYGAGDEHVNYWLREYTNIHNDKARAVEIRRSADPKLFTIQHAAAAYNLVWYKYGGLDDTYVSRGGIRCLTITGGLTSDRQFDHEVITSQLTGTLQY